MEEAKQNLRDGVKDRKGQWIYEPMNDEGIEAKMYYDRKWFCKRVPRIVLPPRQIYYRVYAVYSVFGPIRDGKTGKPLFGDTAWKVLHCISRTHIVSKWF